MALRTLLRSLIGRGKDIPINIAVLSDDPAETRYALVVTQVDGDGNPGGGALPAGTNVIGGTKDAGPQWTSSFGVAGARFTSANASGADVAVTDAPITGQHLVVTDVLISVDTAMRVDLKEETSATVLASIYLPANGSAQFTPRSKLKLAIADKKLLVRASVSGNIAVTAFYHSEA